MVGYAWIRSCPHNKRTGHANPPYKYKTETMDDRTHHHTHSHGGRTHVHASVDHLANELGNSTRLAIRLDSALMQKLGVAVDATVRVATERGRSILARL